MSNEISEYRKYLSQDIIRTCLKMQKDGINQGTSGNVSMRFENGMLITPSSMPYDTMKAEDIVFVDEYGTSKEADFILRGKKKNVKKKANDLIAAVLILENYLNTLDKHNN